MYHFKLCRAILVGFRNLLQHDGKCKDGFIGMLDSNLERSDTSAMIRLYNIQHVGEVC